MAKARRDLTGMVFQKLTVIGAAPHHRQPNGKTVTKWHCICECGNEIDVPTANLVSGRQKACGCLIGKSKKENHYIDVSGRKYGRLTAVEYIAPDDGLDLAKNARWKCICDCGGTKIVSYQNLISGNTKSCGCLMNEYLHTKKTKIENLKGIRFGNLTVLEYVGTNGNGALWKCICDCGIERIFSTSSLKRNRSCGCNNPSLRKRFYFETNGIYPPTESRHWIFLDGNNRNYCKNNVAFVNDRIYSILYKNGWLDIDNPEILSVAIDVCNLKILINDVERDSMVL